jgi:hypothetical protein
LTSTSAPREVKAGARTGPVGQKGDARGRDDEIHLGGLLFFASVTKKGGLVKDNYLDMRKKLCNSFEDNIGNGDVPTA